MKIVVLCGGLSPERDVSISSGTRIAKTLKQNGHQIVLVDMYFGLENWQGSLDDIFDNPPPLNDMLISEQEPDLEERFMRADLAAGRVKNDPERLFAFYGQS